jgi:hypothetical protein
LPDREITWFMSITNRWQQLRTQRSTFNVQLYQPGNNDDSHLLSSKGKLIYLFTLLLLANPPFCYQIIDFLNARTSACTRVRPTSSSHFPITSSSSRTLAIHICILSTITP